MMGRMLFPVLFFLASWAAAEPLYVELAGQSRPDGEALERARKLLDAHEVIETRDKLFVPPFHKRIEPPPTHRKPLCTICHLDPPHRKNTRSRSFLNMHVRYIACETCHLRPKGLRLQYRWVDFGGPPEGTARDKAGGADRIQERPGLRIAPFHRGEPAIAFADHPFARELEQAWSGAGKEKKIRLHARLHGFLAREGPACTECHRRKAPFLDLAALGASERQIRAMQDHVIPRFFARFRKKDEKLRMTDLLR